MVNFLRISLPKEYSIVLLMAGLLAFQCLMIGMIVPGRARTRVYRDPEVKKKIEALHTQKIGKDPRNVRDGYPDHGNGRFSSKEMINYK